MGAQNIIRVLTEAWLLGEPMDTGAGGVLRILPAVDNTAQMHIGNATLSMDFVVYLGAADQYVKFDTNTQEVKIVGATLNCNSTIIADSITVTTLNFSGTFTANTINTNTTTVSGTLTANSVTTDTLNLSGTFTADTINTNTLNLGGSFSAGSVNTNSMTIDGTLTAGGLTVLNSGSAAVTVGNAANAGTLTVFMGDANTYVQCNAANDQFLLRGVELNTDSAVVINGTLTSDNTVTAASIATNAATVSGAITGQSVSIIPSADDTGVVAIGNTTLGMDVKITMANAASYVLFDRGATQITIRGIDIDSDSPMVVNSTITTDNTITCQTLSTSNLTVNALTANSILVRPTADDTGAVVVGSAAKGMDVQIFLGGADTYALFDRGASQFALRGVDIDTNAAVTVNAALTTDNTITAANASIGNGTLSGNLTFSSSGSWKRKNNGVIGNITLNSSHFGTYIQLQGAPASKVTFPSASGNTGQWLHIIHWHTNTCQLNSAAGELAIVNSTNINDIYMNTFGAVVYAICVGDAWLISPYEGTVLAT